MIRSLIVVAALAVGATAVVAQSDPIAKRKEIMKGVGDATKPIGAFLKGEAPYDLAKVQAGLKTYIEAAKAFDSDFDKLFPANSKTGGETTAAPKVWDDPKGFKAILTKMEADATAAMPLVQDQAAVKAALGKVLGNCKACHDDYRIKK